MFRKTLNAIRGNRALNRLLAGAWRHTAGHTAWGAGLGRRHWHRVGTAAARLPNGRAMRMWTGGDETAANRLYWHGWKGYEPEAGPLFHELARDARTTVDCGANAGYYTLLAALSNPDGHVWAFEPVARNAERLRRNVRLTEVGNVTVVERALSDEDGIQPFRAPGGGAMGVRGALSSPEVDALRPTGSWETIDVETLTLDRWIDEGRIAEVDLVKIDVEGTEHRVLAGMRRTLDRCRPILICEILTVEAGRRVRAHTDPLGYRVYRLTDGGLVPVPGDLVRERAWRNYLLVCDESRLRSRVPS